MRRILPLATLLLLFPTLALVAQTPTVTLPVVAATATLERTVK